MHSFAPQLELPCDTHDDPIDKLATNSWINSLCPSINRTYANRRVHFEEETIEAAIYINIYIVFSVRFYVSLSGTIWFGRETIGFNRAILIRIDSDFDDPFMFMITLIACEDCG